MFNEHQHIKIDLCGIVFFVGAINGLTVILYLLFSRDDKRQARFFLAALVAALSYGMLETFLYSVSIFSFVTDVYGYSWVFSIGPSLYFSILTSFYAERISRKRILTHYSTAIIALIINVIFFSLREKPFTTVGFSSPEMTFLNELKLGVLRFLNVVAIWIYFILAYKELIRFQQNGSLIDSYISRTEREFIIKWWKSLLRASGFIVVVWTFTLLGSLMFNKSSLLYIYYPFQFLLVIGSYWVGFTMYHRIKIIFINEEKNRQLHLSKLTSEQVTENIETISNSMKVDKVYLDPELNVTKLSALINLSPKTISAVLNQHLEIGFNDYINNFRVEEVKQRLLDPQNKNLTILAIAFDSGFNSVTTFQRVFKAKTGITPKEFLTQNQK
jgi:AraC-like DNA-binding protein